MRKRVLFIALAVVCDALLVWGCIDPECACRTAEKLTMFVVRKAVAVTAIAGLAWTMNSLLVTKKEEEA